MTGNFYGLDIKLTPELEPVMIEMNGVHSGTDFFRYEQGHSYYRRYARELSRAAKSKLICKQIHETDSHKDELGQMLDSLKTSKYFEQTRDWIDKVSHWYFGDLALDPGWVENAFIFDTQRPTIHDNEDSFYLEYASKEGVPILGYRKARFEGNRAEFTLRDGTRKQVSKEHIGLIHPIEVPSKRSCFDDLILNDKLLETVLANKAYWHFLNEWANMKFATPKNIAFGLGVSKIDEVIDFIEQSPSGYVVRKPATSYCGRGVDVMPVKQAIENLTCLKGKDISEDQRLSAMTIAATTTLLRPGLLDELLVLYEHFVPSHDIKNAATGESHDGCARVVVYSPPEQAPLTLGSQWRLAPMQSNSCSPLNSKYRVNLSRGATAQPIEPALQKIIEEFAIKSVQDFEEGYSAVNGWITNRIRSKHPYKSKSTLFGYIF